MPEDILINEVIFLFALIFSRYLGIFFLTPIFSSQVIFFQAKVLVALSLTAVTMPVVINSFQPIYPANNILVLVKIMSELSVGLFMGLAVFLVFSAVQLGGQIIDMRMGFRIANVVDPFSGINSPVIGQYKNIFLTLIFLAVDGHLYLIKHLSNSFKIIPPGEVNFSSQIWLYFFRRSADMFLLALQVAMPIAGAIFLLDVILAFLARSVPQMNLFVVGLPMKILAGLLLLFVLIPVLNNFYSEIIFDIINEIPRLFRLLSP
ncbi:flagellar biosynthetic protein FliR [Halanaerobium congolense]|uniref:Flagellar biosynthetic protein FliR n=1 Tax=Halanaerobium congolense TaxID=54121 RepID=A0A1I0B2U4_9FIRM|nr:flagellar biosynthetic protein FliR [Halanaerobium congolense]PTX16527.1 flagellar biosynthetic protein FliR [Halanaerobium congolense]SDF58930.1 flagellar biosynthetic protein FliR [Halanaerobium congolense]SET00252.1 flagellar biosynthetic protein FliR [Halanaerobium congolense]SFP36596.1 flagellar biosynthetic protein FliR [Halanaerobium congolense]